MLFLGNKREATGSKNTYTGQCFPISWKAACKNSALI